MCGCSARPGRHSERSIFPHNTKLQNGQVVLSCVEIWVLPHFDIGGEFIADPTVKGRPARCLPAMTRLQHSRGWVMSLNAKRTRHRLRLATGDVSGRREEPKLDAALARGTAPVIKIKFAVADCRVCPLRPQCTRSVRARRAITIRPEAQHEALHLGRAREHTASFTAKYARRAGVEGTIAQGVRSSRLRRTPYFR